MKVSRVSDGRDVGEPSIKGEMPEWSNGPHSKCGVRATVPGVRIPLSPQTTLIASKLQNQHPILHPKSKIGCDCF